MGDLLFLADGTLLLGSENGGLFRSVDDGVNWHRIATAPVLIRCLLELGPDSWMAGGYTGVSVTTDGGRTWSEIGLKDLIVRDLAVQGDTVFAVGQDDYLNVYRSVDRGQTWRQLTLSMSAQNLLVSPEGALILAAYDGLYRSSDGGTSWVWTSPHIPRYSTSFSSLLEAPDGTLLVGSTSPNTGHIHRSADDGRTWAPGETVPGFYNGSLSDLEWTSTGHLFLASAERGIYRSNRPLIAPGRVSLLLPEHDGHDQPLRLPLAWAPAPAAERYRLQLSRDPQFATLAADLQHLADTTVTIDLTARGVYYWRVRAVNAYGDGPWSDARPFATIPDPPGIAVLHGPDDGERGLDADVHLTWYDTPSRVRYEIELDTLALFANPVLQLTDIADTLAHLEGLRGFTTYHWRVRAKNTGGYGPWSSSRSFRTLLQPPAPSDPADRAIVTGSSVALAWTPAHGAHEYRLQLGTDSSFTLPVADEHDVSGSTFAFLHLPRNQVFYWRVAAGNDEEVSAWSAAWSFETALPPPLLHEPADGAAAQPVAPRLTWRSALDAGSYRVQISTDDFATSVFDATVLRDTALTAPALEHGTTYYWRLRANFGAGTSAWSAPWRFRTVVAAPLPAFPESGSPSVGSRPALAWNSVRGASTYHLQLSTAADLSVLVSDERQLTDTTFVPGLLQYARAYYWRVRACDDDACGGWSATQHFTVSTGVDAEAANALPTAYAIAPNYPNPFNPTTTFAVDLPAPGAVSLKVFDLTGRAVATLLEGTLPAGRHTVTWTAGGLPSGTYACRLQAGAHTRTRFVTLLK